MSAVAPAVNITGDWCMYVSARVDELKKLPLVWKGHSPEHERQRMSNRSSDTYVEVEIYTTKRRSH